MFQHPDLARALAEERRRDLFKTVDRGRLAVADHTVESTVRSASWQPVLIRQSNESDSSGLARLAGLDSRDLPSGRFLVAEMGGDLVVAVPLDVDEPSLADPFRPTENLRQLLERQAKRLRTTDRARETRLRTRFDLRRAA